VLLPRLGDSAADVWIVLDMSCSAQALTWSVRLSIMQPSGGNQQKMMLGVLTTLEEWTFHKLLMMRVVQWGCDCWIKAHYEVNQMLCIVTGR
jgi:ABC-type uncharacterized transport system ATPase subunit